MPLDEIARILLERIEERVEALGEGTQKMREELSDVRDETRLINALVANDFALFNKVIDDRIRIAQRERGVNIKDWIGIALGAASVAIVLFTTI